MKILKENKTSEVWKPELVNLNKNIPESGVKASSIIRVKCFCLENKLIYAD